MVLRGNNWLMRSLVSVLAVSAPGAQGCGPSVRNLVKAPRPLTLAEDARVLRAVRAEIAGKRGRLISAADEVAGRAGMEFAVGPDGRLRFLRSSGGIMGGTVGSDGTNT